MPRRKQQFSFLERALKAAGGTATAGVLGEYQKFKAGTNKRNAGTVPPTARKAIRYSMLPFGVGIPPSPDPTKLYQFNLSQLSNDFRVAKGLSNTNLGYETVTNQHQSVGNFYPAVAHLFVPSGVSTNKISGITKRSYKARPGQSYSIPFGCNANKSDQNTYLEQAKYIEVEAAKTAIGASSVSFEPEKWTSEEKQATLGT